MKHETSSVVLGDAPESATVTTILSMAEISATDSSRPAEAAPESSENPATASGYEESHELGALTDGLPDLGVLMSPSGLFAQPEVIIGPDNRVRVQTTHAWPFAVQGHMVMRFPNGKVYIGSGTMVNRHHVLTAGHCVYSRADGGWATSIQFNAGQNGAALPFGSAMAARLLSVKGYTEDLDSNWDMAMLILDRDLGARTGWFGVITFGNDARLLHKRVNVTGYPGDKGGEQMWTHADAIKSVGAERFFYNIDTMGGQSGSGVWSTFDGHQGERVAGIHTTGSSSGNGATRISRAKFDRIVNWFQQF